MSTNFFVKSVSFTNYRSLRNLSVPTFKRINLISGFNGVGKSTFLEGMFFIFDRRGPAALTRPFMWRNLPMNGNSSIQQLFSDLNYDEKISITAETSSGHLEISMKTGTAPEGVTVVLPPSNHLTGGSGVPQQTFSADEGLVVSVEVDGIEDGGVFALPITDGIAVTPFKSAKTKLPSAVFISAQTKNSGPENAERFSAIVRSGRLKQLLDFLSLVNPEIKSLQILQDGVGASIYAQFADEKLLPIAMLGDGVQTLFTIALAIMNAEGGALFLDEFDAAVHYSVLAETWQKIGTLANKYNCQIFAVTHSLECIKAAVEGLEMGCRLDDFMYLRFEKSAKGVVAVPFCGQEVAETLSAHWEIR